MSKTEQFGFSERLAMAIEKSGIKPSPTVLQNHFNLVADKEVTVHAVRKWLVGESIPTQGKLILLAGIVGADPHWLRYGGAEVKVAQSKTPPEHRQAIAAVLRLRGRDVRAVLALARELGRAA